MFSQEISMAGELALVAAYLIKVVIYAAPRFRPTKIHRPKKASSALENLKQLADVFLFLAYLQKFIFSW